MNFWISRKKEKVLEVVDAVDLALMNDAEARQLFDTPNLFRAARGILKLHSKYAMIKKGEHGAILFSDHTYFAVPGFPLENVIDPTGAGDSFAGTLIGYLAKTEDLSEKNMRKAMVYASSVASYNAEGFNVSRIKEITRADVKARYKEFKKIVKF
jgi:ribokinase